MSEEEIRSEIVKLLIKKNNPATEAKWIVTQASVLMDFILKGNKSEEVKSNIINNFLNK